MFHKLSNIKGWTALVTLSMLLFTKVQAQTYVSAPMTGTPAAGSYYSNTSIVLNAPFSFTATGNSTLKLYIANLDCLSLATSLPANQNYIATYTPRVAGITNPSAPTNSTCQVMANVQYIDGLGRPIQTVSVKGSPQLNDIVQPIAYDAYGREATKYLPYTLTASAVSDGSYKSNALTAGAGQNSFYTTPPTGVAAISNPQSVTVFEASPLNRVTEQGAPGDAWQPGTTGTAGHTVKLAYTTNNITALTDTANSTTVALYTVTINSDQSRTLVRGTGAAGYYGVGQLYITTSRNENLAATTTRGGTVEEYKDKEGHVVLKRTFNYLPGSSPTLQILSTYYVYDDLGNLAFVLTPASGADAITPTQTLLDNLCYQYRYDERNRLSQKKLPGKGWEYMVYNQLDQAVLSQDANQRTTNQWSVVKYDGQGRTIMTGLFNAGSVIPLATLQASIYAAAQWDNRDLTNNTTAYPTGYVIGSYPAISTLLSINYYDNYTIPNLPSKYVVSSGVSTNTAGLLTATQTNILGTTNMLWSVHYYDDLGRTIQSYQQHDQGGGTPNVSNYDVVSSSYDFTNEVTATTRQHFNVAYSATVPSVTIANGYTYDHMGRKLQTTEAIATGSNALPSIATILAQNDYNETGQLLTRHLHSETGGAPFLQDVGYTYNERGWVRTAGTGTLFSEDIRYNLPDAGISQQYNGNISEVLYSKNSTSTITDSYSYDEMNRLTNSASSDNLAEAVSYDLMGNITGLTRQGPEAAVLAYTYLNGPNQSNQLVSVSNGGSAFRAYAAYDANGNAPSDGTLTTPKNITYNLLNLPQAVVQGTTTLATYTYDAAGNKLANKGSDGYWDYIGGIVYNGTTATNGAISFIQTEEGRAVPQGGNWHYEYNLIDHLGNVRLSFDKDPTAGTARRIQEDEYYAFGLRSPFYNLSNNNRYLYNGKEVQTDLTSQYDYGARFYDPVIARFTTQDAYAEKYNAMTPYQYGALNPIKNIDMNGDSVWTTEAQRQKNGNTYITRTTHVTGKVIDETSGGNAGSLADGINNKLNNQTGSEVITNKDGSKTYISYNMDSQFQAANSIDDIGKHDNVIAIVDKINPGNGTGQDDWGLSSLYGKVGYVQFSSGMTQMTDLGFHEIGHQFGLLDVKGNLPDNPMSSPNGLHSGFTNQQMNEIWHDSLVPMNHGDNIRQITNKPTIMNNTSTNDRPYRGERTLGMHVILPINNGN